MIRPALTRTHSQASFPRSVALPQLPSPRTFAWSVYIWYTALRSIPFSPRGLAPHKFTLMSGVR